ncbi:MAG: GTP-binding protein [Candidatus Magnetoglobus multicellularis str. Araruama]|uniref:GTP-binding protein n=1 Tax=Candidatus Magnetoglobus multicellularis str. Araruama TaxID=890399 RepID=A0A1V1PFS7_9BACT|nr:MAG: GTP-binding protein [Candidatus Magnetoglobus multicellularis str. Araruama]
MSIPQLPRPACLLVGMFMKDQTLFQPVINCLTTEFGAIGLVSRWFSFNFTSYYEKEMGGPLYRRMISFLQQIDPSQLPDIKQRTNDIEMQFGNQDRRQVNIDPGYLVPERFVLATGKNYTHRIYLNNGIYADLTLIYQKGQFQTLPWTYPDYAADNVKSFLTNVRKHYLSMKEKDHV